jgi:hypothetical protein
MDKTKILMIGRHGNAPQKKEGGSIDSLVDSAVPLLYDSVGRPLRDHDVKERRAFIIHSKALRTRLTAEAIIAGALGYERPTSVEELREMHIGDKISFILQDNALNLRNPHCNMDVYRNEGSAGVLNYWLTNPDATEHNGKPITPYRKIVKSVQRSLSNALNILHSYDNERDLGIFVTHGTLVEPILISMVNTGLNPENRVRNISEIGGPIEMGEFAKLEFKRNQRAKTPRGYEYKVVATLEIKGQKYDLFPHFFDLYYDIEGKVK